MAFKHKTITVAEASDAYSIEVGKKGEMLHAPKAGDRSLSSGHAGAKKFLDTIETALQQATDQTNRRGGFLDITEDEERVFDRITRLTKLVARSDGDAADIKFAIARGLKVLNDFALSRAVPQEQGHVTGLKVEDVADKAEGHVEVERKNGYWNPSEAKRKRPVTCIDPEGVTYKTKQQRLLHKWSHLLGRVTETHAEWMERQS